MSAFEFLMVLVSIIISLGLAEILTGIARFIRCRGSIRAYSLHAILVAAIFLALLQQWWEIWGLRNIPDWSFLALIMMLTGPVGLFLISHLLFPEHMREADLRAYYVGAMRPVWWLAALTVMLSTSFRPLVFDIPLFMADNATSFVLFPGFIAMALSTRPLVHSIFVPVFLMLLLLDIFQWSFAIGPGKT